MNVFDRLGLNRVEEKNQRHVKNTKNFIYNQRNNITKGTRSRKRRPKQQQNAISFCFDCDHLDWVVCHLQIFLFISLYISICSFSSSVLFSPSNEQFFSGFRDDHHLILLIVLFVYLRVFCFIFVFFSFVLECLVSQLQYQLSIYINNFKWFAMDFSLCFCCNKFLCPINDAICLFLNGLLHRLFSSKMQCSESS